MSSPVPVVTPSDDYTAFLTAMSSVLQPKVDRDGLTVDPSDTRTRSGAVWADRIEDAIMALWQRGTRVGSATASPTVTGSAASGGGTVNFEVSLQAGVTKYDIPFLRVVSDSASIGGRVQFWSDSGRTKLVYDRDIVDTSGAAATETYDTNVWAAFASDGTDLVDAKLYGTITNDGGTNSTYSVYVLARGL